jgi:hypothetical protein
VTASIYQFGVVKPKPAPLAPHEEADERAKDLNGLIADDLTGPVGDLEWERAERERGQVDYWSTQP